MYSLFICKDQLRDAMLMQGFTWCRKATLHKTKSWLLIFFTMRQQICRKFKTTSCLLCVFPHFYNDTDRTNCNWGATQLIQSTLINSSYMEVLLIKSTFWSPKSHFCFAIFILWYRGNLPSYNESRLLLFHYFPDSGSKHITFHVLLYHSNQGPKVMLSYICVWMCSYTKLVL